MTCIGEHFYLAGILILSSIVMGGGDGDADMDKDVSFDKDISFDKDLDIDVDDFDGDGADFDSMGWLPFSVYDFGPSSLDSLD